MSGGIRAVSIPNNLKKTIQNIKEITGNHSDDEVYSMLKECSMDPNETTQKLLLLDTFHEVKRRKDRKKEIQTNQETEDSRWRSGPPGRGGRGGRGHFPSRYAARDAGGRRNTSFGKEDRVIAATDIVGTISSAPVTQEGKSKENRSSVTDMANGPIDVLSGGSKHIDMSSRPRSRSGGTKRSSVMPAAKAESMTTATFSDVCSSTLDPVLVPVGDAGTSAVGAIKREVGSQHSPVEPNSNVSIEHKLNAGKVSGKSQGPGRSQVVELLQPSSSSRPSSNYGSRSQQALGSQKVGPNKEWKPKPISGNASQGPKSPVASEGSNIMDKTSAHSQPGKSSTDSEEATNKLQQELESLNVRDVQHVIIPNHIHVPDSVRSGLSFGSFDAAFVVAPERSLQPESETISPGSDTHLDNEGKIEEHAKSQTTEILAEEADYTDCTDSPKEAENLLSRDVSVPCSSIPEFNDSKDTVNAPQHSDVDTSVTYNIGLMPQLHGNPLGSMETSESQSRGGPRVPGFVVQQQVDPSSFYAQFYRSGADDGHVSPFPIHEVSSKYNRNVAAVTSQNSQSLPEGGSSMVFSTAAPSPLVTQATGLMSGSMPITQQPLPMFRQPAGVHIPHYPPNFFPYGHYMSPFYVPPPAMHQFLGNNPFPQQALAGSVYPGPSAVVAPPTAVKFPPSQYKPGSNAGNSAHMGVGGYGPYGASPAGFNPGCAPTTGNATANEDRAASQFKDSVYITGQQSEGSAVWFPGPGRDVSSLPANSFYNLPQGQHVTFAPTQAGQGTYAGVFHPGQPVTAASVHPLLQQSQTMPGGVDMVGAPANVYQQSQHAQMNWPNNY